jgi:hypothetical protein
METYIAYSNQHFQRRWQLSIRHLAERGTLPVRGSRGTVLCGIYGNISQTPYNEYLSIHGTEAVCKRCQRAYDKIHAKPR